MKLLENLRREICWRLVLGQLVKFQEKLGSNEIEVCGKPLKEERGCIEPG